MGVGVGVGAGVGVGVGDGVGDGVGVGSGVGLGDGVGLGVGDGVGVGDGLGVGVEPLAGGGVATLPALLIPPPPPQAAIVNASMLADAALIPRIPTIFIPRWGCPLDSRRHPVEPRVPAFWRPECWKPVTRQARTPLSRAALDIRVRHPVTELGPVNLGLSAGSSNGVSTPRPTGQIPTGHLKL